MTGSASVASRCALLEACSTGVGALETSDRGGQDKANWRSRTRRRWAIEKPLSAHWFLEALRLALNDIRLRPDGAFRGSLRISALQAMALADFDLKHFAFYSISCAGLRFCAIDVSRLLLGTCAMRIVSSWHKIKATIFRCGPDG